MWKQDNTSKGFTSVRMTLDELVAMAEACETTASHYITIANQDEYREHTGRAVQWRAKSQKFVSLAKNLREILAED